VMKERSRFISLDEVYSNAVSKATLRGPYVINKIVRAPANIL
jgi:hypothetical protein